MDERISLGDRKHHCSLAVQKKLGTHHSKLPCLLRKCLGVLNAVSITQEATGKGWPQRWKKPGAQGCSKASTPRRLTSLAGLWHCEGCGPALRATGNPTMQHPSAYYYRQQEVTRPKAPRSSNMSSSLCIRKCHQVSLQNLMSPHCPPPKNDKINRAPPVTLQSLDSKDKMRPTHRPDYQLAINCNWPQAYGYLEGCPKVTFKILFTLSLGPNTHIHHPS